MPPCTPTPLFPATGPDHSVLQVWGRHPWNGRPGNRYDGCQGLPRSPPLSRLSVRLGPHPYSTFPSRSLSTALPQARPSFSAPTSRFRPHGGGAAPIQWVHRVLGGLESNKDALLSPSLLPGVLHPSSSTRHPQAGVPWGKGSPPRTSALTIWGVDNRAWRGWWPLGPGASWCHCSFSCRHHGHLPMGGLQPPGAARTGPVWHHLAPEPDPEPQGRTPCCPPPPLLRIPVRRPAPLWVSRLPSLCLETLAGWQPQAPRCQLPEAHQLPVGHPGAGQALLSFQKHWPTDLVLGLESQGRVSQECPSQPAPVLLCGGETKLPSLALPSCCPWVGVGGWGSPGGIRPTPLQTHHRQETSFPTWPTLAVPVSK